MYDQIKKQIASAALDRDKIATFHLQVLLNASHLTGVDAKDFCKHVGVPESYATEFRKMMKLAQLISSTGHTLT